jgi:hypothetical protein
VGCTLVSNEYIYTPGNDIGLVISPNPSHGIFNVQFYQTEVDNVALRVVDLNGKVLYNKQYQHIKGAFSQPINLGVVSSGVYVVQLEFQSKKYIQKIMVY